MCSDITHQWGGHTFGMAAKFIFNGQALRYGIYIQITKCNDLEILLQTAQSGTFEEAILLLANLSARESGFKALRDDKIPVQGRVACLDQVVSICGYRAVRVALKFLQKTRGFRLGSQS